MYIYLPFPAKINNAIQTKAEQTRILHLYQLSITFAFDTTMIQLVPKHLAGKERIEAYFSGIWNPEEFSVRITLSARETQADTYSIRSLITVITNGRLLVRGRSPQ